VDNSQVQLTASHPFDLNELQEGSLHAGEYFHQFKDIYKHQFFTKGYLRMLVSAAQIKWCVYVSHLKLLFAAGQNACDNCNDHEQQGQFVLV
jgi:hypothetical protein